MKNYLHIVIVVVAGSFFISSCGSLNTAYVDDIYYNPKKVANNEAKQETQLAEKQKTAAIVQSSEDSTQQKVFLSDYDDYEYADRINKFQDDEYQGEYYTEEEDDDADWNMSVNMGYSPYGYGWGMSFGYGYNPYFGSYYSPWYPYYDPWYSWYSPWGYRYYGYPHYGYYPPYYGGCCYGDYYPSYPGDDRDYAYGPRRSPASGSPIKGTGSQTGTRKNAGIYSSGTSPSTGEGSNVRGSSRSSVGVIDANNPENNTPTRASVRTTSSGTQPSAKSEVNTGVRTTNTATAKPSTAARETVRSTMSSGTALDAKENVRVPSYTRTRTEAKQVMPASSSRNGYTPSYTRTRTAATRPDYNTGSGYTAQPSSVAAPRVATPTRAVNSNATRATTPTRSVTPARTPSTSTYQNNSSTGNAAKSSYSAPARSNSSGSTAPRSNSSSGSSYSAPRSSGSSGSLGTSGSSGTRSSGSSNSNNSSGSSGRR